MANIHISKFLREVRIVLNRYNIDAVKIHSCLIKNVNARYPNIVTFEVDDDYYGKLFTIKVERIGYCGFNFKPIGEIYLPTQFDIDEKLDLFKNSNNHIYKDEQTKIKYEGIENKFILGNQNDFDMFIRDIRFEIAETKEFKSFSKKTAMIVDIDEYSKVKFPDQIYQYGVNKYVQTLYYIKYDNIHDDMYICIPDDSIRKNFINYIGSKYLIVERQEVKL